VNGIQNENLESEATTLENHYDMQKVNVSCESVELCDS